MPKVKQDYLDARKDEIIDAAMASFARKGIHGASIADIRDEAGVSNGAIYHYFKTKEEIITALRGRSAAQDVQAYREVERGRTAFEALRSVVGQGMRLNHGAPSNTDARVALMLWAEALTSDAVHESQLALMEPWWELAAHLVDQAAADGDLSPGVDRDSLIDVLTALSLGATVIEAWVPGRVSADRLAEAAEALLDGRSLGGRAYQESGVDLGEVRSHKRADDRFVTRTNEMEG